MPRPWLRLLAIVVLALGAANSLAAAEHPNIVLIMADDMGYAEMGCYGQRIIRTPNCDRLATEGTRFTGHAVTGHFDRLATADSRTVRRGIFDRLVRLGPQVASAAVERLDDKRWFVQRNLLALLGELQYWPEARAVDPWIRHPDPRLRKEAVRAMLRMPRHRERAIVQALRDDSDRQTLRLVLSAAREETQTTAPSSGRD